MEPSNRSKVKCLKRLQCPFTWGTPVVPEEVLQEDQDTLVLPCNNWSVILGKILLAYQYTMNDDVARSKKLLLECYLPLLEVKGLVVNDSDLIEEYRVALKHVVDSTWVYVCCKTNPIEEVGSFLESITPFSTMTDCQKSAVWGIRGRLSYHEEGLRATKIAINLNPNEGQWRLYRGLLLDQYLDPLKSDEKMKNLEDAFRLRPTSECMVFHAMVKAATAVRLHRPNDLKKGLQLLRDAVEKWPNNPYLNFECGRMHLQNLTNEEDLVFVERCLRNAVRLAGPGHCKAAYRELGSLLFAYKDEAEGAMYLQMAQQVIH